MPEIATHTLSCGMPVILESMSGVRSIGINWLVPAGFATDPEDRQGLCAMLAELVFRGAGELDSRAQADAMDRLGVSRSCEPGSHHLRLGFALTGDRLLDALAPIVDMVRRPRMEEESIEPTRDLCVQAIESLADDPQQRAILAARARHNDWPFSRSGLGTKEGLAAATRNDLLAHWSARVRPGGSILAIAGDLPPERAKRVIDRLEELLKDWRGEAPGVTTRASTSRGSYEHITDPSTQVQVVLVHDAPAEKHPDAKLERIVSSVLSGGMSCRLFSEVREKRGLCYSVSQSYATDRDYGRCLAYVGTTPERAQESLDVLTAELARISTPAGAVTPDEFQRAIIGIKSNIIFSGESSGARAGALATDMHRLGRARSLDEIAEPYRTMKIDDVNQYLARRSTGLKTIVTLGPAALTPPK